MESTPGVFTTKGSGGALSGGTPPPVCKASHIHTPCLHSSARGTRHGPHALHFFCSDERRIADRHDPAYAGERFTTARSVLVQSAASNHCSLRRPPPYCFDLSSARRCRHVSLAHRLGRVCIQRDWWRRRLDHGPQVPKVLADGAQYVGVQEPTTVPESTHTQPGVPGPGTAEEAPQQDRERAAARRCAKVRSR